jgi:hypothetical protein
MSYKDIQGMVEHHKEKGNIKLDCIICDLDVITSLAKEVDHITEFGVRRCISTYGWLAGKPSKYIGVDISTWPEWGDLIKYTDKKDPDIFTDVKLIVNDDTKIEIEETDLLFIDSLHTYDHVTKQIELHSDKVKKYMVFHDALNLEGGPGDYSNTRGVYKAIMDFMATTDKWEQIEHLRPCGLLILKRIK